jgi:flagella basal body P-ring formation protein FlgA
MAQAQAVQDLDLLEARLVGALGAEIGQPGGPMTPIDRRMKLAACPAPVQVDPPAMGAVALRCPQIGWRIRVPLMQGGSMQAMGRSSGPMAAMGPMAIKRGDPVQLVADAGSFMVSTEAVAQEDGSIGSRIRVRTDPKNPNIIGQVIDTGIVRVTTFK